MKKIICIPIIILCFLGSIEVKAQDQPFLGEIRMFAGTFPPRGWAFCEGQLLPINTNQALFSLLGTTYGGDGRTTFALPDFRGRVPVHKGQGSGLSNYQLGQKFGTERVTVTNNNLPAHTHPVNGVTESGTLASPQNNYLGDSHPNDPEYASSGTRVPMNPGVVGTNTTTNTSIDNRQPVIGLNYIICTAGIFPSRS